MSLAEWTMTFVKHKDIIKQQLVSLQEKNGIVHAVYKGDKKHDYFIFEKIPDFKTIEDASRKSDADANYSINVVCYNTSENLKVLIHHWKEFSTHSRLLFYFVNPKSQTDVKWILNPWLHSRISDSDSLETGLKSMFSMVEEWRG